jgi:hypothetical protein
MELKHLSPLTKYCTGIGGGGSVGGYQHDSSYTSGSYSGYSGGNSYYTDYGKYGYPARDGYQPGGHRGGRGGRR